MRKLIVLTALIGATWALPATAMTSSQAECPAQLAPNDLGALATVQILNPEADKNNEQAIFEGFKQVVEACMVREHIAESQADAYGKFVISRVIHADMVQRLGKAGISPVMIDRVFDLGPGRSNPGPDDLTDAQFEQLSKELAKVGMDFDRLPDGMTGLIGGYVGIAGEMYRNADLVR